MSRAISFCEGCGNLNPCEIARPFYGGTHDTARPPLAWGNDLQEGFVKVPRPSIVAVGMDSETAADGTLSRTS